MYDAINIINSLEERGEISSDIAKTIRNALTEDVDDEAAFMTELKSYGYESMRFLDRDCRQIAFGSDGKGSFEELQMRLDNCKYIFIPETTNMDILQEMISEYVGFIMPDKTGWSLWDNEREKYIPFGEIHKFDNLLHSIEVTGGMG